eukprot:1161673-Pelagomonas_calceolata.AAC.5
MASVADEAWPQSQMRHGLSCKCGTASVAMRQGFVVDEAWPWLQTRHGLGQPLVGPPLSWSAWQSIALTGGLLHLQPATSVSLLSVLPSSMLNQSSDLTLLGEILHCPTLAPAWGASYRHRKRERGGGEREH